MLYIITDTNAEGRAVERQYIEAASPEQARRKAGPMPTLTRTTVPAHVLAGGLIVPA